MDAAIRGFFDNWKARDFVRMAAFTQKTWRAPKGSSAKQALSSLFGSWRIKNWSPAGKPEAIEGSECFMAVPILLETTTGERMICRTMLICEEAAMKPSKDGDWGVNPISVLRRMNG